VKALFSLVFLGVVLFCAIKIVPVYVENYELQDYINHLAVDETVRSPQETPEAVQNRVFAKAESLGLPVELGDIKVSVGRTVLIDADYLVYVDLKFFMLPLHFTPSAKNSNI